MGLDIAGLFKGLRARSRLSLEQALQIRRTEGVDGILVIHIPAQVDRPCEMFLTTGRAQLVQELWKID